MGYAAKLLQKQEVYMSAFRRLAHGLGNVYPFMGLEA